MLQFYWLLGHDIVERQMENTYGSGFFKRLSAYLQRELPDAKGFSPTNIKYIKYFYELYSPMLENRQQWRFLNYVGLFRQRFSNR